MTRIATYGYLNSKGGQYTSDLDRCPTYGDLGRFVINGSYDLDQLVKRSSIVRYIPDNIITVTATQKSSGSTILVKVWSIKCYSQYPVDSDLTIHLGLANKSMPSTSGYDYVTTEVTIPSGDTEGTGSILKDTTYKYWYYHAGSLLGGIPERPSVSPVIDDTYYYSLDLQTPQIVTLTPINFTYNVDSATPIGWDNLVAGQTLSVTYTVTINVTSSNPTNLIVTQSAPIGSTLSNDYIQSVTTTQRKLHGKLSTVVTEDGIYPAGMTLNVTCSAGNYSAITRSIGLYYQNT